MMAILVIGVMFVLLMPAKYTCCGSRARFVQCQNNMRQIGLGMQMRLNIKNAFPNAGTIYDDPQLHQGDPTRSNIDRVLTHPEEFGPNSNVLLGNWVVELLPYFDDQEMYNTWNFQLDYLSTVAAPNTPSNAQISNTAIGILHCPEDHTAQPNQGNLSYVVNGGFTRWPAIPISWTGSSADGRSQNGEPLRWSPPGSDWKENQAIGKKLGVMFLGSQSGDQPWDIQTTSKDITDGAANTLLAAENTLVGYTAGESPYSGKWPTNWACPLPNFAMFLGSDNVCQSSRSATDCLGGQLAVQPNGKDGAGWIRANLPGTHENISFGQSLTVEGSFPFANSSHLSSRRRSGSNFVFCDASVRFISATIDGTVYSKILTPAGESLPVSIKQSSLSQDAFAQ